MSDTDEEVRVTIAQEAAVWFVRNRAKAVSAQERAAFGLWLKSSPMHVEEYLKTAVIARDLHTAIDPSHPDFQSWLEDAQADDNVTSLIPLNRNPSQDLEVEAGRSKRRRPIAAIMAITALAASILAMVVGVLWLQRDGERFGLPKRFVTVHAEQGSWLLPDGTSMSLNSDSAVTVRYNAHERVIEVERGQALFHVAHARARRFRVIAGEAGVIAVGTEFDVFRKSGSTLVTVVEGKVAVFSGEAPTITTSAVLPPQTLSVGAGEQIQVADHSPPARASTVNVQQAVAWVQRQVAFTERPLGEVAAEFNRYGAVPIVVESERLRELPISGIFNAYDTDSFVAFIGRLDGVEIDRTSQRILVRADARSMP
jgi:transmembrane sensor